MINQALSFGAVATEYDRIRPTYPPAAVRWALDGITGPGAAGDPGPDALVRPVDHIDGQPVRPGGPGSAAGVAATGPAQPAGTRYRVVDRGAGTGILTRVLLELGAEVVPVEPDAAMRARLTQATGGLTALAGSAEHIPLPDGSVDAVLAGQAYHWFDKEPAHAEIARVLRSGGVFAPLWNLRDRTVPWVAEFDRIIEGFRDAGGRHGGQPDDPEFGPEFGPVTAHTVQHRITHGRDSLLALVRSRSFHITATPQVREQVERGVHELLDGDPALAGRTEYPLPYKTIVFRANRR